MFKRKYFVWAKFCAVGGKEVVVSDRKVIVESDSKEAVECIQTSGDVNHPLWSVIRDCRELLNRNWVCEIRTCLREENRVADYLAKRARGTATGVIGLSKPPDELLQILHEDHKGYCVIRSIVRN